MREAGIDAHYTPGFDDAERWLLYNGRPGDLVLTMGCGNVNLLNDQMQKNEAARAASAPKPERSSTFSAAARLDSPRGHPARSD